MKSTLWIALGIGAAYLIWKASQKKQAPAPAPSPVVSDELKTFEVASDTGLFPKAILKDYDSSTGATISKSKTRLNIILV